MNELERLEQGVATGARPLGALALAGAWGELEEDDMNSIVEETYAGRERDLGCQGCLEELE